MATNTTSRTLALAAVGLMVAATTAASSGSSSAAAAAAKTGVIAGLDYGPLVGLIGTWKSAPNGGVDVAPGQAGSTVGKGNPAVSPYYETITYTPAGGAVNASDQNLAALYYRQQVFAKSDNKQFHDQTGYLIYDKKGHKVYDTFCIPRGVCIVAEGAPGTTMTLKTQSKGVAETQYMLTNDQTQAFRITFTLSGNTLKYAQTTDLQVYGKPFSHTDSDTLKKTGTEHDPDVSIHTAAAAAKTGVIAGLDYGPLVGLIGTWKSAPNGGVDVAPGQAGSTVGKGNPAVSPYYETITYTPAGGAVNASDQNLAALYYRQQVFAKSDNKQFHDQTGYLIYDKKYQTVYDTFCIPRGVCVVAEGAPGTTMTLKTQSNGVAETQYMLKNDQTQAFRITFTLSGNTLKYAQTTDLQVYGKPFSHTDSDTLKKTGTEHDPACRRDAAASGRLGGAQTPPWWCGRRSG